MTTLGAYPGFGPGMPILNYLLDYGDCVARVRRNKAVASILKGWPRPQERRAALTVLANFTWNGDDETQPWDRFLIEATPFVGYRWNAELLREWINKARGKADEAGPHEGLDQDAATLAAAKWIELAKPEWEQRTQETFPYDIPSVVYWWIRKPRAPALP